MTTGAIIFMSITWIGVIWLVYFCFSRLLRPPQ